MKHDNAPGGKYKQLDLDERESLALGLSAGKTQAEIARELGRSPSTLSRELTRNSPKINGVAYRANRAQLLADQRKKESHHRLRLKRDEIRRYVREKLHQHWSPEQIAHRMEIEHPEWKTNYESIYQFIYTEFREGIGYLRFGHKTRRRRGSAKGKRSVRVPNRTMIDRRPKAANGRQTAGHWEADTMVSRKGKQAIAVLSDRKTRLVMLTRLKQKTAKQMNRALVGRLSGLPPAKRKTITYDNGTENALHEKTNELLGTRSFFCRPYHSWEKGTVENTIGLVRQYLPKGCDLGKISGIQLRVIENALNNRPRKCLGYLTPREVDSQIVALRA